MRILWNIGLVVVATLVLKQSGLLHGRQAKPPGVLQMNAAVVTHDQTPVVSSFTAEQVNLLEKGMSYTQCSEILGGTGTYVAAMQKHMKDSKSRLYCWQNKDKVACFATFKDDKLIGKALKYPKR